VNPDGVLVIGLDGGTLRILGPLAERGVMPALRRLMVEGRSGTLRSTLPWYTIPGWTSLMTGVHPGTHGLLHWVAADPAAYFENVREGRRFVTSADLPFPTFWDVAGAAGRRVAVVNMPATYPAWPVNGVMVTGLLTPHGATRGVFYPEDLSSRFPGYRVDLSASREADSPDAPPRTDVDRAAYVRELIDLTKGRETLGTSVIAGDVDLGVIIFVGPDRISHRAWAEQASVAANPAQRGEIAALVLAYYRALDHALEALIEAAGPDATVMVVADHGSGPPAEQSFAVNAWLREGGYLKLRASQMQVAIGSRRTLKRMASPIVRRWKRKRGIRSEHALVDWSRSTAYAVKYPHTQVCGIVVNRKGLKREGWVREEDAHRIVERLRDQLAAVTDPSGRKVVVASWTKQELGATAPGFPDLMVETDKRFFPADGLLRRTLFQPDDGPSGIHEREGIFVVWGPRVRDEGPADADIVDVAPTVLGLLGIDPPSFIEGKVRRELFEPPASEPAPTDVGGPGGSAPRVSDAERQEIEEHLQVLGYVE
jgi:predicted AlkP superfamily phosphohydrolase/phosphomutase